VCAPDVDRTIRFQIFHQQHPKAMVSMRNNIAQTRGILGIEQNPGIFSSSFGDGHIVGHDQEQNRDPLGLCEQKNRVSK
jgi:hypothetical protein